MAISLKDKDMEVRRKFDKEMKKFDVEITRRSNPMKMVTGKDGKLYLCDQSVDAKGDLEAQGCWDYDRIPVPRHA